MKKIKTASLVTLGVILVILAILFLFNILKPKYSGIHIETTPLATVYIDGVEDGRTPYDKKDKKPGEYIIKLVPDSYNAPLAPYETKVNLVAGVQTVIRRSFGDTDETSSSEIISFEKIDKNQVSLAVVSVPDSAELLIDGSERAFTPHRTTSLLPGAHTLTLSANGYQEMKADVRTYEGYKLTAVVKLAKSMEQDVEDANLGGAEEETDKESVEMVKILSTPTGFLRVRSEPSTLGEEVGTVEPDEEYELIEEDEETGWYKIKFIDSETNEETEGWVSNQYTEKVETEDELTPTPTTEEELTD